MGKKVSPRRVGFYILCPWAALLGEQGNSINNKSDSRCTLQHTHTHTHSSGTGPRWLWYIWSPNNWGSGLTQSTLPAGATETRAFPVMGDKAAELFWWQAPLQGLWQAIPHGFACCREPEEERKTVVGHKVTGHLALKHIWDPLYRLWELVE